MGVINEQPHILRIVYIGRRVGFISLTTGEELISTESLFRDNCSIASSAQIVLYKNRRL